VLLVGGRSGRTQAGGDVRETGAVTDAAPNDVTLDADERGAVRSYLQRSEVRLSTIHRVASALLSGAGLMVLLPALERDSVTSVLRALLNGSFDMSRPLLVLAVGASVALPFAALWLVLRDLTQFYFYANHVRHAAGESFTPRFTLTGLRLPHDELGLFGTASLDRVRNEPRTIELLVPANDAARARIDRQIAAYGGLGVPSPPTDAARARALFDLAASRPRDLFEEVAKVEHGMARHVLRIQLIVLRYVKAVLAMLTTLMAAFALAAVVEGKADLGPGEEVWVAAILLVWSPVVIYAVTSPVRWLESQLRSEGVSHTGVADDRELTRVEDVTVRLALAGFAAALVALIISIPREALSAHSRGWAIAVGGLATVAVYLILKRWAGTAGWRRIVRRA
jgi:hypothetical protein